MKEEYLLAPKKIDNNEFRADSFTNGEVLHEKRRGKLPAMGWNSWNAFGSGNTEKLTKIMADKIVELGLDKLGYEFVVLDDGCYKAERIDGKLSNEEVKFPSGFKALADYIHDKGLKFGMYNDIGTNLCAGAAVGTCGHEDDDAQSYIDWDVDFLKVDNCYYLWDNATFSDAKNAKYVFAPAVRGITLETEDKCIGVTGLPNKENKLILSVSDFGHITGCGVEITENKASHIGSFDGTGPVASPVGPQSGELRFYITATKDCECKLTFDCTTGEEEGIGAWLQLAVDANGETNYFYDDFIEDGVVNLALSAGDNEIRIMNHRRQENTLGSYAALLEELNRINPDKDITLSICEWGKTSPQNWGYKVGHSWRILNDITFRVGSDGDPGYGAWNSDYTTGVTSQYNKAVIMDDFSGPDKGYNDPDMLMVGMIGLTPAMNRSHMAMWCMMNSPLMLGLDLRRVKKNDELYEIIGNETLISFNQDKLGVQAKRVYCSLAKENPDKTYVRDNERVDILAKPLADGSIALSFLNLSETNASGYVSIHVRDIVAALEEKTPGIRALLAAKCFEMRDVWTDEVCGDGDGLFEVEAIEPCDNKTYKITAIYE